MTNGIGILPTAATNTAGPLPRRTPGASGHKPAGLAPRPALPRRTIPLSARPLSHDLADQGWEQAA